MVIVKNQSSHLMYLNIDAKNNNPMKIKTGLVIKVARIIMKEKTPLSHEFVHFRCLILGPQI